MWKYGDKSLEAIALIIWGSFCSIYVVIYACIIQDYLNCDILVSPKEKVRAIIFAMSVHLLIITKLTRIDCKYQH